MNLLQRAGHAARRGGWLLGFVGILLFGQSLATADPMDQPDRYEWQFRAHGNTCRFPNDISYATPVVPDRAQMIRRVQADNWCDAGCRISYVFPDYTTHCAPAQYTRNGALSYQAWNQRWRSYDAPVVNMCHEDYWGVESSAEGSPRECSGGLVATCPPQSQLDAQGNCVHPPHRDETCPVGHPCLPGTGTKVLTESDYIGAGVHALGLMRSFRSYRRVSPDGSIDSRWMHTYQARIALPSQGSPLELFALRSDGSVKRFTTTSTTLPRTWLFGPRSLGMWADEIPKSRKRGLTRCCVVAAAGEGLSEVLSRIGLRALDDLLAEIDAQTASAVLTKVLSESLVDHSQAMPISLAERFSADFVEQMLAEGARFFTNGNWTAVGPRSWNPMTEAVLDGGVVAFGPALSACVWCEEDA